MRHRRKMLAALSIATCLAMATPAPTSAQEVAECTFDGGVVTVTPEGVSATVKPLGGVITVDGIPCGAATVTNTDRIDVLAVPTDAIRVDTYEGSLAPGATDEGDGSSEIEVHVTGEPYDLMLWGTAGSDAMVAGSRFVTDGPIADLFAEVNMNALEAVPDADVVIEADSLTTTLTLVGDKGDDELSASGWGGEPISESLLPTFLRLGPGNDHLAPGSGNGSSYDGGAGFDTFDLSWLDADCRAVVLVAETLGSIDSSGDCQLADSSFVANDLERLRGHPGVDVFEGSGSDDRLFGGGGDDLLRWSRGADLLHGGAGTDRVDFGPASVGVDADLAGAIAEVGTQHAILRDVEDLTGSDQDDVLAGGDDANDLRGGAGVDRISGRAGADVLGGGLGDDPLDGGPGTDACSVESVRRRCETDL